MAIPQTKCVMLSVSEISHRTIDLLNKLSLRGKRSDEANSREGEFPCHCEPQARQSLGVKYAAYTPTIIQTDRRSRYAPSQ